MTEPLNILIVEDNEDDCLLLLRELSKGGYQPRTERVDTAGAMRAALARDGWDIVISDYLMPKFSGLAALQQLKESGKDIPFIIVSGNIGEDIAVEAMRAGAHDYIIKGNLARLIPAIQRELREAEVRRQRRLNEVDLSRLNRVYAVLSQVNEAIIRTPDRDPLLASVCRIMIETGGFKLAWVGNLDPVSRKVLPVAAFGSTAYLEGINIVAADVPEGRGPTGRAIYEKRPVINMDFDTEENMRPWRERARGYGIRSSSAFPLMMNNEVIGALTVYSDLPSFFNEDEISLLRTSADNLSFALDAIRNDQKRFEAEAEIIQSANEISDLYNNAPCGYHSIDTNGVIVRINDTELAWLGYTREEVLGKLCIADIMTSESAAAFKDNFPVLKQQGQVRDVIIDIKRKNGTILSMLLNATAVRDRNGDFLMSRTTLYDITERRETERQIQITNKLLYLFAQNFTRHEYLESACNLLRTWIGCGHVGLRIVGPDDKAPFEACCGYDEGFLKQESDLSLTRDRCICTRIIAGAPEPTDLDSLTANGSFVSNDSGKFDEALGKEARGWYRGLCVKLGFKSLAVIPIKYRDRNIGAIHLADDQDGKFPLERVKFIEQLAFIIGEAIYRFGIEDEQKRLASALESTAEAVVITDPHTGIIRYMNPAFSHVTGYSRDEVIGQTLHFLDSGKQGPEFYDAMRKTLKQEGFWQGRLENKKKDGSLYLEDCTYSPVRNSRGEIINYVSVRRDVTEKLRLESIAEAVNSMNNIGYVFTGVRHEIGNPINSAKMSLSVLMHKLEQAPKEVVQDYVLRALGEIGRVEQLLKNLKTFTVFEKPEQQVFDLRVFLEKLLVLIAEDLVRKKGIRITHAVSSGAEYAFADPRGLQQVMLNIVTNAADALIDRPGPEIAITAHNVFGRIQIQVADNGSGMTEKQQKDLFKPFYTSKAHGTGLGLVIVKKMLALMNGEIEIESRSGQGTTIYIYLPEGRHERQQ